MFSNVVVDLETGGLDPARSMVIQIAAVKFNPETREVSDQFFDRCLLPQPNRFWDESTREFWMKRKDVLQEIMNKMEPPRRVLEDFLKWVEPDSVFWGKPTHFDFSFLQNLFRDYDLRIPFHYRKANDLNSYARGRYAPEEPPNWERILEFQGPLHNALYDCLHQLRVIYKVMDKELPNVE